MNVPLLDLGPMLEEQRQEIIEKVIEVVESTRYIQGPEVEGLEEEMCSYCKVTGAVGVSSGTDALAGIAYGAGGWSWRSGPDNALLIFCHHGGDYPTRSNPCVR